MNEFSTSLPRYYSRSRSHRATKRAVDDALRSRCDASEHGRHINHRYASLPDVASTIARDYAENRAVRNGDPRPAAEVGRRLLAGMRKARLPLFHSFVRLKETRERSPPPPVDPSLYPYAFFCDSATPSFLVASSTQPFPHAGLFAVTSDTVRRACRNIIVTFTQISWPMLEANQDGDALCSSSAPAS